MQVIGIMSGSSLDGLDFVLCDFVFAHETQMQNLSDWKLLNSTTLPLPDKMRKRLMALPEASARELIHAHADLGHFIGKGINQLLLDCAINKQEIELIASHGHTIFHEPLLGFTCQIGDGAAIAAETGIPVICDFRVNDVAYGGQGAPLAPLADRILFPGYDYYLNIGGISNVTAALPDKYIAFDISGANQILNALSSLEEMPYDEDGKLAAKGILIPELFEALNNNEYFDAAYPKSLSNQWVQQFSVKTCMHFPANVQDRLHTACHHIGYLLRKSIRMIESKEAIKKTDKTLFATGGGALNKFLMKIIAFYLPGIRIIIPETEIVKSKEGLLMALMGALRWKGYANCISTVTGAEKDAVGGAVYLP
jgi:anhydro-N-acetylmuramic acid kinase